MAPGQGCRAAGSLAALASASLATKEGRPPCRGCRCGWRSTHPGHPAFSGGSCWYPWVVGSSGGLLAEEVHPAAVPATRTWGSFPLPLKGCCSVPPSQTNLLGPLRPSERRNAQKPCPAGVPAMISDKGRLRGKSPSVPASTRSGDSHCVQCSLDYFCFCSCRCLRSSFSRASSALLLAAMRCFSTLPCPKICFL